MMRNINNLFPQVMLAGASSMLILLFVFSLYGFAITTSGLLIALAFIMILFPICFLKDIFHPFILLAISTLLAVIDFLDKDLGIGELRLLTGISRSDTDDFMAYSLLVIICWYIFVYFGYWAAGKLRIQFAQRKLSFSIKYPVPVAAFLGLGVVLGFLYTLEVFGGLSGMLSAIRDPVRAFSGYSYLKEFVSLGGIAAMLMLYAGYKKISLVALTATCVMLFFFGGRAAVLLQTLLPYLMVYHYNIKKIKLWKVSFAGIFGLVFVSVVGAIRKTGEVLFTFDSVANLITDAASDTGRADTVTALIGSLLSGRIDYQLGAPLLNILYAPIPRTIWENKPDFIDESVLIGSLLLGGTRYYGLPPGPYAWAFYNFWWLGVIIMGFLAGFLVQKLYSRLIQTQEDGKPEFVGMIIYSLIIQQAFNIFATSSQIHVCWVLGMFLLIYCIDYLVDMVSGRYTHAVKTD